MVLSCLARNGRSPGEESGETAVADQGVSRRSRRPASSAINEAVWQYRPAKATSAKYGRERSSLIFGRTPLAFPGLRRGRYRTVKRVGNAHSGLPVRRIGLDHARPPEAAQTNGRQQIPAIGKPSPRRGPDQKGCSQGQCLTGRTICDQVTEQPQRRVIGGGGAGAYEAESDDQAKQPQERPRTCSSEFDVAQDRQK